MYWRLGFSLAGCILAYCIVLSLAGYTIVPIELGENRGLLPWGHEQELRPDLGASYKRDGDSFFEHFFYINLLHELAESGVENGYDNRVALGYEHGFRFANCSGLSLVIAEFLHSFNVEFTRSTLYAINLSAGIWGALIMILIWLLGSIWWRKGFSLSVFFGLSICVHPLFFLSSQEPWLIAFASFLLLLLAISYAWKGESLFALGLAFASSVLLWYGRIFQFYIYIPVIVFAVAVVFYRRRRSYWPLIFGFVLGVLPFIASLQDLYQSLGISNKNLEVLPPVEMRKYAGLLLGSVIEIPQQIAMLITSKLGMGHHRYWLIHNTVPFLGAVLILIGLPRAIVSLKGIWLIGFALLILYWLGPLHWLLTFPEWSPVRSETSIRAGYLLMPLLGYFTLERLSMLKKVSTVVLFSFVIIGVANLLMAFFSFRFLELGCTAALVLGAHGLLSAAILHSDQHRSIPGSLVLLLTIPFLVAFSNTKGGILHPSKTTVVDTQIAQSFSFRSNNIAVLAQAEPRLVHNLHPNFIYLFDKIRSVHAYRNPFNKSYSELFLAARRYVRFGKISLSDKEYNISLRNNWLGPFNYQNGPEELRRLERILQLFGASHVFSPSLDSLTAEFLHPEGSFEGVDLFTVKGSVENVRPVTGFHQIERENYASLEVLFGKDFDPRSSCSGPNAPNYPLNDLELRAYSIERSGKGEIIVDDRRSGLLFINMVYTEGKFKAFEGAAELRIIPLNHCFFGIEIGPSENERRNIRLEVQ